MGEIRMNNEELIRQAKIQGFAKAVEKNQNSVFNFPIMKQLFIQEIAETVFLRMVENNINYDDEVKKREYIKEILDFVFPKCDISQVEQKEVFELIVNTLNNLMEYVITYYDEGMEFIN